FISSAWRGSSRSGLLVVGVVEAKRKHKDVLGVIPQAFFIDQGKQTTNLASVSMSRVRRLPVALPSAAEQTALVEIICERLAEVANIAHASLLSKRQLAALDRAILGKAFRG